MGRGRKAINYKVETILKAISNSFGILDTVAKRLRCACSTAQKYIDKYEVTKEAFQEERTRILDLAESSAVKLLKLCDPGTVKYILNTKGRERGYGEHIQIDKKEIKEIKITVEHVRPESKPES
jgi:hypothetical protein